MTVIRQKPDPVVEAAQRLVDTERLREIQKLRGEARQELDKDRMNSLKYQRFHNLDREYSQLVTRLSQ